MNDLLRWLLAGWIVVGLCTACSPSEPSRLSFSVHQLKGFPTDSGFSKGVSALYAGRIEGGFIMAGGCNFPDVAAADGGQKVYYKNIYRALLTDDDSLCWTKIGALPSPSGYGAAIDTDDGLIIVGGQNASGRLRTVVRLRWNEKLQSLAMDSLPDLPQPRTNMSGVCIQNRIYIVGGQTDQGFTRSMISLDLSDPTQGWRNEPDYPGAWRTQSVAVVQERNGAPCLFLFGGFAAAHDGFPASVSLSALCYQVSDKQWTPIAAPTDVNGDSIALGGGAGMAYGDRYILLTAGVNKDRFLAALNREARMAEAVAAHDSVMEKQLRDEAREYMLHDPQWYRFNDRLLCYDVQSDGWTELGRTSFSARAGAALVAAPDGFILINGERKPGIRTAVISKYVIKEKDK